MLRLRNLLFLRVRLNSRSLNNKRIHFWAFLELSRLLISGLGVGVVVKKLANLQYKNNKLSISLNSSKIDQWKPNLINIMEDLNKIISQLS